MWHMKHDFILTQKCRKVTWSAKQNAKKWLKRAKKVSKRQDFILLVLLSANRKRVRVFSKTTMIVVDRRLKVLFGILIGKDWCCDICRLVVRLIWGQILISPTKTISLQLKWCSLCCTVLHWTELHYAVLNYSLVYCTALQCTSLHCTALHCIALHCIALRCTALDYTYNLCITLNYTRLHYTYNLHFPPSHKQGIRLMLGQI